ncbi:NAD-dependent epimerase/dehydratase family protein [Roseobacter sp. SK209-2-6]|uniref:NAD-dependent epimerase/dehydratase family protein n=1 Tax=Roseobacter sp. SK209-2-6 TaxID=388739 RepID=UPI0012F519E0|nr:NAD(P)-dependent oxidoreductase [Roseobacter sp. SK209-2-6]
MKFQKILVTGSSGLIGTALCSTFESLGHEVRRFDITDTNGGFGDVLSPANLASAMVDCTGVVHLAAVSRVIWGQEDPEGCYLTNVIGTQNVIDQLRASALQPWLIFGSSREVYGQSNLLPVTENTPLRPMNDYARSKVAAEKAVQRVGEDGFRTAVLRFSTVYGSASDHRDRVIPAFCRAALSNHPLRVEGAANILDITHVSDVADNIMNVVRSLSAGKSLDPMHLTTGQGTSLMDLAHSVVRLSQSDSEIVTATSRDFDVKQFVGDPKLAETLTDWCPGFSLELGLMELISQYRRKDAVVSIDRGGLKSETVCNPLDHHYKARK